MYCDGRCQYLNERKHKCELTGEKLTYMKQTGSISFSVHEHRGFCKGKKVEQLKDEQELSYADFEIYAEQQGLSEIWRKRNTCLPRMG